MKKFKLEALKDSNKKFFELLNREWLERYFEVETVDEVHFNNPIETIIDKGGKIFFVSLGGQIIGTCALIKDGNSYELAKMAVTEKAQGLGAGKFLIEAALDYATSIKANKVYLSTNSKLHSAIHLYEKYGFKHMGMPDCASYARCDMIMEKQL